MAGGVKSTTHSTGTVEAGDTAARATLHYLAHSVAGLTQKWVRLAPNGTNPGLFQIRFQYILARRAKMYWNLIWKIPGIFRFRAIVTNFGHKYDIRELN